MVTALIVLNGIWLLLVLVLIIFSKGINIRLEIPEIKVTSQPELVPFEDTVYDEEGNEKNKISQDTIDEVLTSVNKIMFGDDIVEGSQR